MEKFDVLNELNDEFKQRVKILYVFEDYDLNFVLKGYNVYNVKVAMRTKSKTKIIVTNKLIKDKILKCRKLLKNLMFRIN
jgi:hypothetical protein